MRTPVPSNIKIGLVLLALGIVIGLLFYTQSIVDKLQQREKKIADLAAEGYKYIGSDAAGDGDIGFIFDEVIRSIVDFPIIIADPDHEQLIFKNIDIDSTWDAERQQEFLRAEARRIAKIRDPIVLKTQDTIITQYVYYDESAFVKQLRILPYIEIGVAGLFILLGYFGFSYIKRSEQSNIWVGLAKETAHQLGTPLSSMMGWMEMLRYQLHDPEAMRETMDEMNNDLNRLNRIAMRFSKIGAVPELVSADVGDTIRKIVVYLQKRAPSLGNKVIITFDQTEPVYVRYNAELLEWVFENLAKNALDAIEHQTGKIDFQVFVTRTNIVIDVTDNGKGIDRRVRKDIFRPGFSTKKRGWGLGLSLSRRIVEDYHGGKLTVHDSAPGKGTTFRIKLPAG